MTLTLADLIRAPRCATLPYPKACKRTLFQGVQGWLSLALTLRRASARRLKRKAFESFSSLFLPLLCKGASAYGSWRQLFFLFPFERFACPLLDLVHGKKAFSVSVFSVLHCVREPAPLTGIGCFSSSLFRRFALPTAGLFD